MPEEEEEVINSCVGEDVSDEVNIARHEFHIKRDYNYNYNSKT
jgi:hypothetical protein